jgi:hypothetical protein
VRTQVEALLRERLARFGGIFTRIEVHFHPGEGANLSGLNVSCGLEGRVAGKKPLKVHHTATGMENAAGRAIDKLITVVNRRFARKATTSSKGHVRIAGGSEPGSLA